MRPFTLIKSLVFSILISLTLIGCGSSDRPTVDDANNAILSATELAGNYAFTDNITVESVEITNQWVEQEGRNDVFYYEYIVNYHYDDATRQLMGKTNPGYDHETKRGTVSLVRKGTAWYFTAHN